MAHSLFDRNALAERMGNDPATQREIIELFLDIQPQKVNELAQAVARDDALHARAIAHSLAGAFRSMAMPKLGDTAKALERAAAGADLDECRTLFLELDELFARVCAEVSDDPDARYHSGMRVEVLQSTI